MARVKCPCGRKVGYLRSLWMVYMQVCQPFRNSNVIYSILEPINIHNLYTFLPGLSVLEEKILRRLWMGICKFLA